MEVLDGAATRAARCRAGPGRRRPAAVPAAARAVIARVQGFEVVGEATSGEEAVELVDELHPGLVLMDINMGAIDGMEATRQITTAHPETFVILVSTYTEADLPPAARTCGAMAYVNKDELSPRVAAPPVGAGGDPAWLALGLT